MVKQEPVSIRRQTVYALLPFLDLYAAYKIQKFRWYFVIIFTIGIALSVVLNHLLPFPYNLAVEIPIELVVSVYLIRRWSKEWNKSFSENNGDESK